MKATIEKLYKEWRSVQPVEENLKRRMDQQFMFDFNYNSNHIEGNTLTYGQTKMLLLFGEVTGSGSMQDFEEMKAHNLGFQQMKIETLDKNRALSESFIRELNRTILVRDYYKLSQDRSYRYKIHVGTYKTRPNSVITPTGEVFDYASPEETPSMMADLVRWYNEEEQKGKYSVAELAAIFHYRYIRIHPFEDGNGRIARLVMNYIFLRHGYPMIVVRTEDRKNYLKALQQCDLLCGKETYNGANATLEETKPLVDYIESIVEAKLSEVLQLVNGDISESNENNVVEKSTDNQRKSTTKKENTVENVVEKMSEKRKQFILQIIKANSAVSANEIAKLLSVNTRTIQRDLDKLKSNGTIERIGGDRGGYWKIK